MESKVDNLLKDLMNEGYTVSIEAKGRGREYAMTYEVYTCATFKGHSLPLIAFGDSLEDALESLRRQIDVFEE